MEFDNEEKVGDHAEELDDYVIQANSEILVRSFCTTQVLLFIM